MTASNHDHKEGGEGGKRDEGPQWQEVKKRQPGGGSHRGGGGRGGAAASRGGGGGNHDQERPYKPHRHRPNTTSAEQHVYPLTLRISPSLHDPLNELRTRYFPQHRLKVPAHLTLFHALPHSRIDDVKKDLDEVSKRHEPFTVKTGKVFKMGPQGVAIDPHPQAIEHGKRLHGDLRRGWAEFLSKQDAKEFKAHWTIMNKEEDREKVDKAFEEVREWQEKEGPKEGEADGLVLWKYDHGKWIFEQEWDFRR